MASTRDVERSSKRDPSSEQRIHDFALVVGVDDYPSFRSLRGAVTDATAFHHWVCSEEGGGVDRSRARLITSTPDPATPLQDHIDQKLLELIMAADERGGGHRLYFYFSGHGATSPIEAGDDVALLLASWSRHLARLALSSRHYSSDLSSLGLFTELVIFLDCCRTASVRAVGQRPAITYEARRGTCATRTFIAYATEAGSPAFELQRDEQWQGVFTKCLLTILKHAEDGVAAATLKDRLEWEVAETNTGQRVHVINGLRGDARFGRSGILPLLRVCVVSGYKRVCLWDGHGVLVEEHEVTAEPWLIRVKAGLYKLESDSDANKLIDHGREEVTNVDF